MWWVAFRGRTLVLYTHVEEDNAEGAGVEVTRPARWDNEVGILGVVGCVDGLHTVCGSACGELC